MNATRAAWPRCRTELPTRFRPDLRVVHHVGVPAAHARPIVPSPVLIAVPRPAPAPLVPAPLVPARYVTPPSSKASPLRLTRRGRIVIAVMAAFLVAGLWLAVAGAAQATSHVTSSQASSSHLTRVVVRPGQTLWSVAESADPNADPRQIIQQIAQLNGLTSETVAIGQRLWVPRS